MFAFALKMFIKKSFKFSLTFSTSQTAAAQKNLIKKGKRRTKHCKESKKWGELMSMISSSAYNIIYDSHIYTHNNITSWRVYLLDPRSFMCSSYQPEHDEKKGKWEKFVWQPKLTPSWVAYINVNNSTNPFPKCLN